MYGKYPLNILLKDKTKMICRPVKLEDLFGLRKFYNRIPKKDLEIFKDNLVGRSKFINYSIEPLNKNKFHVVALKNKRIVADGVLHSDGLYWGNAAEIIIIVDPKYRNKGLGSLIFGMLLVNGIISGIQKILIRYASDDIRVIKILEKYGFKPEIIFNYYIEDKKKKLHKDLIVSSFNVQDWKRKYEFYSFSVSRIL